MERMERKDLIEATGLVGIIASLMFLAFEIQQNTGAIRSESAQGLQDQIQSIIGVFLDESVNDLAIQGFLDPSALSPKDSIAFAEFMKMVIPAYQNVYYLEKAGTLDSGIAAGWYQEFRNHMESPGFRESWENLNYIVSDEFREFVNNDIMAREPSPHLSWSQE